MRNFQTPKIDKGCYEHGLYARNIQCIGAIKESLSPNSVDRGLYKGRQLCL
jgi:hypothetical protein